MRADRSEDTNEGSGGQAAPTGRQFTIAHGPWAATVVEVGGGLRSLAREGIPVLAGFEVTEACRMGRGQQLIPWPNRIRDGRYTFAGQEEQLPLTEVSTGNAIHGLVRWALWEVVEHVADSVTVRYRLHPQPGWPHHLELQTTYAVGEDGLVVTPWVRNDGNGPAPFGYGSHPYLSIGSLPLDEVRLSVPGKRWMEVDDRSLPIDTRPVEGTRYDFRDARPPGTDLLDTAYTDLALDPDGRWRVTVSSEPLGQIALWAAGAQFPWLQVFTGAVLKGVGEPGIAVEPMTCPADAFNSGESLLTLDPGEEWTGTWGIAAG
jgi:aldose 1-epimerase